MSNICRLTDRPPHIHPAAHQPSHAQNSHLADKTVTKLSQIAPLNRTISSYTLDLRRSEKKSAETRSTRLIGTSDHTRLDP